MTTVDIATIERIALMIVPILVAVILHEVMHGVVAYWCGDPTAKEAGRLTLNPLPHIDPFGSILFPAVLYLTNAPFLFGWARPVPFNVLRLRKPRRDVALVAVAGPLTNIVLAAFFAALLHWLALPLTPRQLLASDEPLSIWFELTLTSIFLNIGLAVFNLLPILPLDGGRVLVALLPRPLAVAFAQTERYGLLIVMLVSGTSLLGHVTRPVHRWLLNLLL